MSHNQYRDDSDAQRRAEILSAWTKTSHPSLSAVNGSTSQQLVEAEREASAKKYRPTLLKRIASWASVGLGALGLIGLVIPPAEGVTLAVHVVMYLTMAVFFGLPGAYWHACTRRDSKKIEQWIHSNAAYRDQLSVMSESDRQLMSPPENWPNVAKRHWPAIWAIVVLAIVIFGVVAPDSPPVP